VTNDNFASIISLYQNFKINIPLLGGKGGFGSLLRSAKSLRKTTNFGACRDSATGRRLRDIENEKKLKTWNDGEIEREYVDKKIKEENEKKISETFHEIFDEKGFNTEKKDIVNGVAKSIECFFKNTEPVKEETSESTSSENIKVWAEFDVWSESSDDDSVDDEDGDKNNDDSSLNDKEGSDDSSKKRKMKNEENVVKKRKLN